MRILKCQANYERAARIGRSILQFGTSKVLNLAALSRRTNRKAVVRLGVWHDHLNYPTANHLRDFNRLAVALNAINYGEGLRKF